jgi:hypothetical protein
LIFHPKMAQKVKAGLKTQTRRKVNENECRYRAGRVYSIQTGRGKPASGHITITEVRQEQLGDITLRDARREGFRTTADFKAYWLELHGKWQQEQPVWVISFVLGDQTDRPRLLAARFDPHHGDYVDFLSRALSGSSEEVAEPILKVYAKEGEARYAYMLSEQRKRALDAIGEIKRHAPTGKARKELTWAEKRIRAIS